MNSLVEFENNEVRRIEYNGEWYFSVVDIVKILTGSLRPRKYWDDLKRKLKDEEGFIQVYEKIVPLKMIASDGKNRGAAENDYAIFTAIMSKATFDLTPNQHKEIKGLKRENLRDHMSNLEITLTMLGEATAKEIHKSKNTQGKNKLKEDVFEAGKIAGNARKEIEKKTRKSIVSSDNFLNLNNIKRIK